MPLASPTRRPTFQRCINTVLSGLTWQICLPFVDDVVVWSKDFDSHCEALEKVFTVSEKLDYL